MGGSPLVTMCFSQPCCNPRLSVLSFPVRKAMGIAMQCESLGVRDPKRAAQFIGNCMAFSNAALIHMIALSCFKRK